MKFDKIVIVYVFVALARLLYGLDGAIAHYMFHFDDFAIATYFSAGYVLQLGYFGSYEFMNTVK